MIVVYILYSRSLKKYYVGQSSNLKDRLERHNSGRSRYTKLGIPWELKYEFCCSTRSEAMRLERKIKKRGAQRFIDDLFGV
ncbi:GIY-YIG nuclease family protein [Robiginitalea sp.]|uniref:GIY-YIG nuclease family protein n=1 Tax=Robiginitalea sp. TaxID=1902411 RepID=UPI003C42C0C6